MREETQAWVPGGRYLALMAFYGPCFFALFYLASFFADDGGSLWYPAAGLRMAMLLLYGLAAVPSLALAEVLAIGGYGYYFPESGFGQPSQLVNVGLTPVIYGLGAWVCSRFVGLDLRLRSLRDSVVLLSACLSISLISSLRNAWFNLGWSNPDAGADSSDLLASALVYWLGDAIGILMLTPLLLVAHQAWRHRGIAAQPLRQTLAGFGVETPRGLFFDFLVVWLTLFAIQALPRWIVGMETHAHWYVAFLPVIWISFRHGLVGSIVGVLATHTGVAWLLSQPLAEVRFRELQVFLVLLAITGLLMGSMVSTLRRQNQKLRDTELRLEADNRELEVRNAEMERFAYSVSHDLKSPLMTMQGFLGFLKGDLEKGDADQVQADLGHIEASVEAMEQLIFELLEFSRIGPASRRQAAVSLGELTRDAVWLVTGQIQQRGVKVKVSPDLPTVMGDRPRLLQVMQNLIDNAVKFMGEQTEPRIEVTTRRRGAELVVVVRDNGMGIEPDDHEAVFGLFDRLDRAEEGTGVGLALVRRVIEEHGGRIWIESEGQGKGTAFCFTLESTEVVADEGLPPETVVGLRVPRQDSGKTTLSDLR